MKSLHRFMCENEKVDSTVGTQPIEKDGTTEKEEVMENPVDVLKDGIQIGIHIKDKAGEKYKITAIDSATGDLMADSKTFKLKNRNKDWFVIGEEDEDL